MSPKGGPSSIQPAVPIRMPPLRPGDRLTRAEFERRYEAMPQLKKAELIEGFVFMPSPVHHKEHGKPHSTLSRWLTDYSAETPGTDVSDNATVRLDLDNEPQPDVLLRIQEAHGGRSREGDDDFLEGPPELIAEVLASSASYDLHARLNAYRRNGVLEYIVWRTFDGEIDWFSLEDGEHRRLSPGPSGVLESRVFPGLRLDPRALLDGDLNKVRAVLGEGLRSPEHAEFRKRFGKNPPGK
jgi:Uma2 family endonuclease